MRKNIGNILMVFKEAGKNLAANEPLRMAGATGFFTTFALPPVLMIIVRTFGLFFDRKTIGKQILDKVGAVLGNDGRELILSIIRGVRNYQHNLLITCFVFIFLLFVATTLFKVVKGSINQLWNIRIANKRNLRSILIARSKAVGIIMFTGVLFLAVMGVDLIQAYLGQYLHQLSPVFAAYVFSALNHIVSFVVVTVWFFALFRYLPDGRPKVSVALTGAAVTGLLFTVGKFVLRWLLSGVQVLYGTSGAMVLIMLFVFYSSLMLYFGAAFTRAWGKHSGNPIQPLPHAAEFHWQQVEVKK
ncbi:MAG: YihY/virulence factor BrkB family protein [Sphingobacteriales bacterium]|nr:MAG: YihY/virulence factor BrkB family protein [Sphingobacteriales bacterium]